MATNATPVDIAAHEAAKLAAAKSADLASKAKLLGNVDANFVFLLFVGRLFFFPTTTTTTTTMKPSAAVPP